MSSHRPPLSKSSSHKQDRRYEISDQNINIGNFNPKLKLADILADEVAREKEYTDHTRPGSPGRQEVRPSTPARHKTCLYNPDLPGESSLYMDEKFLRWEDTRWMGTPGCQVPSPGGFSDIEDENVDPHPASSPSSQEKIPPTPSSFHSYGSDYTRTDKRTATSCSPEPLPTDPETPAASSSSPLFEPLFKQITAEQRAYIAERREALSRARHHYSPGRKELSILAGDDETASTSSLSRARPDMTIPQKRTRHGKAKETSSTTSSPYSSDNSDSFEIFPPARKSLRKDPPNTTSPVNTTPAIAPPMRSSLMGFYPTKSAVRKPTPVKPRSTTQSPTKPSPTKPIPIKLTPEKTPRKKAPSSQRRLYRLLGVDGFDKSPIPKRRK